MTLEYRTVSGEATAGDGTLDGLVTPFNTATVIGDLKRGGFNEQIAPGAFTRTLQDRDVVLLWNHDTSRPLARSSVPDGEGSLSLREDSTAGLRATAKPVQTGDGADLMKLVKAGVVRGMSFGFEVARDSWTDRDGNPSNASVGLNRTIHEVRLHEVSAVTFPAYPTTSISARDQVSAARENRAAKATYGDLETCGECGATGQYGAYCGGCGEPMRTSKPSGDFCTSCGGKLDTGSRSAHVCEERKGNPKPYGDVDYADPKNGKYPLDTEAHAKAAWAYINMPKNSGQYPMNGVSLVSVKDAIKAALIKFGVKVSEENGARLAVEFRDFTNPHGVDMAADGQGCSCLAAVDATLDSAMGQLTGINRNELPPEVNQFIDLVSGAAHLIGEHNKNSGIPDPDKPNGNSYESPTDDDSDGSDDSGDSERLATYFLLTREF